MQKSPLISVIVPVYNAAPYLARCIESILAQTYKNLEIILVDDGSTDNCLEICQQYAQKDNRIKVIHQENKGLPATRNTGLGNMHGDFVAFVDADDWLAENAYELLLQRQQQSLADLVTCNFYRAFDYQTIQNPFVEQPICKYLSSEDLLLLFLKQGNFSACNKLYRRNWVGETRFDTRYTIAEDWAFVSQLAKKGGHLEQLKDPLYFYYQRAQSMLHTGTPQGWYLATQLALDLYNEFKQSSSKDLRTRLLGSLLSFAGAFSLVALLSYESPTDAKLLQSRKILKTHVGEIIRTHAMGVFGKGFSLLFIAFPKLTAWICSLPGIKGLLKKAFAKTR